MSAVGFGPFCYIQALYLYSSFCKMSILFILLVLSVSLGHQFLGTLSITRNATDFNTDVENVLEQVYRNDTSLDTLEESVIKSTTKIEVLVDEINSNGAAYVDHLENETISQIFHSFDSPLCLGEEQINSLKKSFRIELGLLEVPVRETIAELKDKIGHMKRWREMERSILEMKLTACLLTQSPQLCTNYTSLPQPCFNDSCSPPVPIYILKTSSMLMGVPLIQIQQQQGVSSTPRKLLSTECSDGRFKCKSGTCTNFNYVCDGGRDCPDGSDERNGCQRQCSGKRCRNLNCISEEQICNGIDDCGDRTDEENCIHYTQDNCNLSSEKFLCDNKKECLPLVAVCNGIEDCTDASDEGPNCSNSSSCDECGLAGGSCLRTPTETLCLRKCPSNFTLDLKSSICTSSPLLPQRIYETNSFMGTVDKLKVLFNRFSIGVILLKKHVSYLMEKAVSGLNNCMNEHEISLNNPFPIF